MKSGQSTKKLQNYDHELLGSQIINDDVFARESLTREDEDLGIASLEGLLKWSSQLDINDI